MVPVVARAAAVHVPVALLAPLTQAVRRLRIGAFIHDAEVVFGVLVKGLCGDAVAGGTGVAGQGKGTSRKSGSRRRGFCRQDRCCRSSDFCYCPEACGLAAHGGDGQDCWSVSYPTSSIVNNASHTNCLSRCPGRCAPQLPCHRNNSILWSFPGVPLECALANSTVELQTSGLRPIFQLFFSSLHQLGAGSNSARGLPNPCLCV